MSGALRELRRDAAVALPPQRVAAAVAAFVVIGGAASAVGALDDVEWRGDFVEAIEVVAFSFALIAVGFAWPSGRTLAGGSLLFSTPLVALDLLYFVLGINLAGYCGEPKCDPGPIPLSVMLMALPFLLILMWIGIELRGWSQRQRAAA